MTRMESMDKRLTKLKEEHDFDKLFNYTVSLACDLVESDETGRAMDRALEKNVTKRRRNKIAREFIHIRLFEHDEFGEEKVKFYEKWCKEN